LIAPALIGLFCLAKQEIVKSLNLLAVAGRKTLSASEASQGPPVHLTASQPNDSAYYHTAVLPL
jgi:hypothetical protein